MLTWPVGQANAEDAAALQAKLDAANKKVAELDRAYQYRYQSQSQLAAAKVEIKPQNNPLRRDKEAIRSIKKSAKSMTDLWTALTPFAE